MTLKIFGCWLVVMASYFSGSHSVNFMKNQQIVVTTTHVSWSELKFHSNVSNVTSYKASSVDGHPARLGWCHALLWSPLRTLAMALPTPAIQVSQIELFPFPSLSIDSWKVHPPAGTSKHDRHGSERLVERTHRSTHSSGK